MFCEAPYVAKQTLITKQTQTFFYKSWIAPNSMFQNWNNGA